MRYTKIVIFLILCFCLLSCKNAEEELEIKRIYYPSGHIKMKTSLLKTKQTLHGWTTMYYDGGKIYKKLLYADGTFIEGIEYEFNSKKWNHRIAGPTKNQEEILHYEEDCFLSKDLFFNHKEYLRYNYDCVSEKLMSQMNIFYPNGEANHTAFRMKYFDKAGNVVKDSSSLDIISEKYPNRINSKGVIHIKPVNHLQNIRIV